MNTTRLLSTLAAATALAGSIGLAFAQTTDDSSKAAAPASTEATPMQAPMPAATPSAGSMDTPAPAMTDSPASTMEPAPKIDRG
jgi:hypothetical protein